MSKFSKAKLRHSLGIGLCLLGGVFSHAGLAQDILGNWDLTSAISLRGGYENEDGKSSFILSATPEFNLRRRGDDFSAEVSGNVAMDKVGQDQFAARSLGLQANYGMRLNQHSQVDLGASYSISQPRALDPVLPTDVKIDGHNQQFSISGGYAHQFSRTGVLLRGSISRSQTAASLLNDATFKSNGDQNGWTYGVGGRVTRELTPMIGVFVDGQLNRSRYDEGSIPLAATRDSWSYEAQVGATINLDERLSGDFSIGQLRQTFDDASLKAVQTLTYNAALQWQASDTSLLSLDVNTSVSPSRVVGEPMQIVDVGRLTLNQQMNSRTQFSIFGELERQHYQTSADEIRTSRAGLGLQYQANKQLSAFANYSFALREEPTKIGRTHKVEAGLRFNRQ